MYSNYQPDFNHCLILGLKNGLMDGDLEIRQLKDKLFSYIMKEIEMKTRINDLRINYNNTIGNMQSKIETLKRDLQDKEDKSVNLNFKFDQLRALFDEKLKEIEVLRNETNKLIKTSQKEEYRLKYRMLKRKLKIVLKNRHNNSDSKILQDISSIIMNDEDNNNVIEVPEKSCLPNKNCLPAFNNIKMDNVRISIESLSSPALSTISSVASLSEKSPNSFSLCYETETTERERLNDLLYPAKESMKQKNSEDSTLNDNIEKVNSSFDSKNEIPIQIKILQTLKHDDSGNSDVRCMDTCKPAAEKIVLENSICLKNKRLEKSEFEDVDGNIILEKINSENEKSKSSYKTSIFEPVQVEEWKSPSKENCVKKDEKKINFNYSWPNETDEDLKPSQNLLSEKSSKEVNYKSCSSTNVSLPQDDNIVTPNQSPNLKLRTSPKSERVKNSYSTKSKKGESEFRKPINKKTGVECKLSSVERLYIDEESLGNTVEHLLRKITEPLKPIEEIESLQKFYEEPDEVIENNCMETEMHVCESTSVKVSNSSVDEEVFSQPDTETETTIHNSSLGIPENENECEEIFSQVKTKTKTATHNCSSLRTSESKKKSESQSSFPSDVTLSKDDQGIANNHDHRNDFHTSFNISSFLNEISANYDSILKNAATFEEFARKLESEPLEDRTSNDGKLENEKTFEEFARELESEPLEDKTSNDVVMENEETFEEFARKLESEPSEDKTSNDVENEETFEEFARKLKSEPSEDKTTNDILKNEALFEEFARELESESSEDKITNNDKFKNEASFEEFARELESEPLEDKTTHDYIFKNKDTFEEFARKLQSEPSEDKKTEDRNSPKNENDSDYVLVFEISDPNDAPKRQLSTICDEILNDWAITDNLNEVDLQNVKTESPDHRILEYTCWTPPSYTDLEEESELEEPKLVIAEDEDEDSEQNNDINVPNNDSTSSFVDTKISDDSSVSQEEPFTRYNLRQKSVMNYAFLANGVSSSKRTLSNADILQSKKNIKFDHSQSTIVPDNNEQVSSVLSECDINNLEEERKSKRKSFPPKFYVENRIENDEINILPEKTHFEQVWSKIKNLNIDESKISYMENSNLIFCNKSLIHTAFALNVQKKKFDVNNEKIINLSAMKRCIEEYLRQKRISFKIAMTNLIASVRLSNRTTTCTAIETVLLNTLKSVAKKNANVFDDLIFVCLEIDRKVFEGFVNTMKAYLKGKIFTKTYNLNKLPKGQNMISCTILHSQFYATLNKVTINIDDTINLLYESLMSLKNRAHPIAYGVLSQWPDVFNSATHKRLLISIMLFCFVHHKMNYNSVLYKTTDVQGFIGQTYNVKLGDKTAEEYAKEAMINIYDIHWVDAIVLLCKRQSFSWAYTNVIMKYFIPLFRIWKTHNVQESLLLKVTQALQKVMLSCPYDKEQSNIYNIDMIIRTLSDLLLSEEISSRILKETVCLTICELSSHRFSLCMKLLSSWVPADCKISYEVLSQMHEIMKKKNNYRAWLAVIAPDQLSKIPKFKKISLPKKHKPKEKGVISVGVTRASRAAQTQAEAAGNKLKKKKRKKKKKNGNRNV